MLRARAIPRPLFRALVEIETDDSRLQRGHGELHVLDRSKVCNSTGAQNCLDRLQDPAARGPQRRLPAETARATMGMRAHKLLNPWGQRNEDNIVQMAVSRRGTMGWRPG